MKISLLPVVILVAAGIAGCGPSNTGPQLDPSQFPKALINLESKTDEIIAAFESGEPQSADRPMHQLSKLFGSIKRLAEPAGLDAKQQAAAETALTDIKNSFGELHAPMHKDVFPEDFDFAPIRDEIREGLKMLRAALPAGVVAELQAASDKRAAKAAEAAEKAEAETSEETAAETPPEKESVEEPALTPSLDPPADEAAIAPEAAVPAPDAGAAMPAPANRVAAVVANVGSSPPGARNAPLCPSLMMFDAKSLALAAERMSRVALIQADAPLASRWVQLVPTLHARLRPDNTIEAYGLMGDRGASWTAAENFTPASDDLADRFRDAFAATVGQAVRLGVNVSILPHLDPSGGPHTEWRNLYRFRPAEPIGPGSYESLLIDPLADAIVAEATSDTRIDLALSGEMGRSLFEHPEDYLRLTKRLQSRFAAQPNTANVRVGVALNWSGLAGDLDTSEADQPAIAALVMACDFVGFSCYAPVSVPPTADDFTMAVASFRSQLFELTGVPVPLKRLVLSETGIGGGLAPPGPDGPLLPTVEEIAAKPYEGRGGSRRDPWSDPAVAELRRQYHAALCDYLAGSNGAPPAVEKAFIWSEGPWDPQGIAGQRFRDEAIANEIAKHNAG